MVNSPVTLLVCFVLVIASVALVPHMTRRTENFGVTIPEKLYDRQDFQKMRWGYTILLVALGILFGLFIYMRSISLIDPVGIILTFVFIAASFLFYLPFHFKMKKIKNEEQWYDPKQPQSVVVDLKFRNEKLTVSNWCFFLPGIVVIATVAMTFIFYEQIPDQIPIHTGPIGNVTYDQKSLTNLLILPWTQLFLLFLFIMINLVIKHAKQQVHAAMPIKSRHQDMLFRRRWSGYIIGIAMLTQLLLLFLQLTYIYPNLERYMDMIIILFTVITIASAIILAALTGQGGGKINTDADPISGTINQDEDQYWKLGQFYVNRNDPSIFVEKRFGVGWTNNWAHPLSWVFIIVILAIPLILTLIFM